MKASDTVPMNAHVFLNCVAPASTVVDVIDVVAGVFL